MSEVATAQQLFGQPPKRRFKTLDPMPVSGLVVRIRSLTEREMSKYQAAVYGKNGQPLPARLEDANRRLLALCMVDGEGNPICTHENVAAIGDWDAADSSFVYGECASFCGISKKDIEDLVKNSDGMSGADSPTS